MLPLTALFAVLGLPLSLHAAMLDHWQARTPTPAAVSLYSTIYSNGTYTAVGEAGVVVTSTNALDWYALDTPTGNTLWSICQGPGSLVAVGDYPTILRSTNGSTWQLIPPPAQAGPARAVIFAQGEYIATAAKGVITSPDGAAWTYLPINPNGNISGLAFGQSPAFPNGLYVAGTSEGIILTSTNRSVWEHHQLPYSALIGSVAFGNDTFVCTALDMAQNRVHSIVSTNGRSWTKHPTPLTSAKLSFAKGQFFATGSDSSANQGAVATSTDGISWSGTNLESGANYSSVVFDGEKFLMVGSPGSLFISTNSSTWTNLATRIFSPAESLRGVAFGAGTFVAVGNQGLLANSRDGKNWHRLPAPATAPTPTGPAAVQFTAIAYGNGKFVASGSGGVVQISPDGTNWSTIPDLPRTNLTTSFFGTGRFLVGGEGGTILTSTDGSSWHATAVEIPFNTFTVSSFCSNHELFLASGIGATWRSYDATNWTRIPELTGNLRSCAYGAGRFVVSAGTSLYTSPDGTNWVRFRSTDRNWPSRLYYLRDTFLGTDLAGDLRSSSDGTNWVSQFPRIGDTINSFAYASDTFLMLAGWKILQSGALFTLEASKPSAQTITLQLQAPEGPPVIIESSSNLQQWSTLTNWTPDLGPLSLPFQPPTFYRARLP